jgi:hypothetical protein
MELPVRGRKEDYDWESFQCWALDVAKRGNKILAVAEHKNAAHDHMSQLWEVSKVLNQMRHYHQVYAYLGHFGPEEFRGKPTRRKA